MAKRTEYEFLVRLGAEMDKSVNNVFGKITKMAAGIFGAKAIINGAKALGSKILDIGQESIELASQLETSAVNAANVFGGTADQVKENQRVISDAALQMSLDTKYSAEEITNSMYYMGLAGMNTKEVLGESLNGVGSNLENMLKLAAVSGENVETVIDLVTDSMQTLGQELNESNVNRYMDELTIIMSKTNTNATQAMESIIKYGSAAGATATTLEDTIALTGILANRGIKDTESGTALNSVITRMTANSTAAKGYSKAGVDVYDETGTFRGVIPVLEDLGDALERVNDEDKFDILYKVFGTHQYSKALGIVNALNDGGEALSEYEEIIHNLGTSKGTLNQMYEEVKGTYAFQKSMFDNHIDYLKISLGESLLPIANEAMGWITDKFFPGAENGVNALADYINTNIAPNVTTFLDNAYEKVVDIAEGIDWDGWIDKGMLWIEDISSVDWVSIGSGIVEISNGFVAVSNGIHDLLNNPLISALNSAVGWAGDKWSEGVEKGKETGRQIQEEAAYNTAAKNGISSIFNQKTVTGDRIDYAQNEGYLSGIQKLLADTQAEADEFQGKIDALKQEMQQTEDPVLIADYEDRIDSLVKKLQQARTEITSLKSTISGLSGTGVPTPSEVKASNRGMTAFASGGIVTQPTLGLIGEAGENEAVIPLSKIGQVMRSIGGNSAGNITYAPVFQISGGADVQTIKQVARDSYADFKSNLTRWQRETARRAF